MVFGVDLGPPRSSVVGVVKLPNSNALHRAIGGVSPVPCPTQRENRILSFYTWQKYHGSESESFREGQRMQDRNLEANQRCQGHFEPCPSSLAACAALDGHEGFPAKY